MHIFSRKTITLFSFALSNLTTIINCVARTVGTNLFRALFRGAFQRDLKAQEMLCYLITLWFTIHCTLIHITAACECLSNVNDPYKCHFGTMTPYRYIANYNDSQLNYPGCTEQKVWMLIRHGTRFPAKKATAQMINMLPKLQQRIIEHYNANESMLSAETVDEFAKWKFNLVTGDEMKLTEEGERELVDLAERFQSRFPSLLSETYSNATYKLKHTPKQRAEQSAKHFALGLFGHRASQQVWYHPPQDKDIVLRAYKNCDRWQSEVHRNPAANKHSHLFAKSETVNETLNEISKLLGFTIDYDTAYVMYSMCAFETAWTENATSPWCKLFSLHNFEVVAYVKELNSFWIDGYGFALNSAQACAAFRDVFEFFKSISEYKATVYFSHSGSILKLLTHLGLAKDAMKLTHDSFDLHRDNRAWRVSCIGAFASNIGFILYECEKEGPSILIMHQERVVQIPGCPEDGPCPISVIEALFSPSIYECDLEKMCKL